MHDPVKSLPVNVLVRIFSSWFDPWIERILYTQKSYLKMVTGDPYVYRQEPYSKCGDGILAKQRFTLAALVGMFQSLLAKKR